MIYKQDNIDMSLVQCPYEEDHSYIYIADEYTNNILKLSGYSDISDDDFRNLCDKRLLVDKLESYALKSPEHSYKYAKTALNGRFELGEPTIATDTRYAYNYARYVLDGRFKLGEPAIATNSFYSYKYAKYTLKGIFELGESAIATDAHYSYWYARDVLKGRFELGEPAIASDGEYSYKYRHDIFKSE